MRSSATVSALAGPNAAPSRSCAILEAYHTAPLHLFSMLDRDITLDFLADYPSPVQAGRLGTARMGGVLQPTWLLRAGSRRSARRAIRPHLLSASPGTTAGKQLTAGSFGTELRSPNEQLKLRHKRIDGSSH